MKKVKIELTVEELLLVTTLLSDQLFRREFIDPKMPGYKGDPSELTMGKELVVRLKSMARDASGSPDDATSRRPASHLVPSRNVVRDAG